MNPQPVNPLQLHVHRWEQGITPAGPALLLLHGTGGDENDLIPLAQMIAPGMSVLGVRGNVLEQGAPRFFRRLAEGVFDLPDLHRRTGDLADFIGAASARYGFDRARLYAVGFSNGANIAASVLLSRPDVLAGGVLIRAMVPFEPDGSPDLTGKSVLLSQGRLDPMIPVASAERLGEILRNAGASVELAWQPGGHQLSPGDVKVAREWLHGAIG